jgi:hypothetical protein
MEPIGIGTVVAKEYINNWRRGVRDRSLKRWSPASRRLFRLRGCHFVVGPAGPACCARRIETTTNARQGGPEGVRRIANNPAPLTDRPPLPVAAFDRSDATSIRPGNVSDFTREATSAYSATSRRPRQPRSSMPTLLPSLVSLLSFMEQTFEAGCACARRLR